MSWLVEALKIGALGLAFAVIVYTARQLSIELKRPRPRPDTRNLILLFMGFGFVMFLTAAAVQITEHYLDNRSVAEATEREQRLKSQADSNATKLQAKVKTLTDENSELKRRDEWLLKIMAETLPPIERGISDGYRLAMVAHDNHSDPKTCSGRGKEAADFLDPARSNVAVLRHFLNESKVIAP